MSPSIYLINPANDHPGYFGAEVVSAWGSPSATVVADLASTTVAALIPDHFEVSLVDEMVSEVDLETSAEFIALTGKTSQQGRIQAIAQEFRRRGKVVILGGPYASLCSDAARGYCDILVRGEIEEIAAELFSDLAKGSWKPEYMGTRPDLGALPSAVPRWDLYPNDRALVGAVQTSRGCPFECDFCDVIQYLGRRQRHKSIPAVLEELDVLYEIGYRNIFLTDDNFTASRSQAKALLKALKTWNTGLEDGKVLFSTQLSIDAAKDDELLRLCSEAGLIHVFIGIETPNEVSLRDSKKRQNLGVDLAERIQRFYDHGMMVVAGMIVGFDGDGPDIFARQLEFITEAALPIVTIGALVAPEGTPLRDRLQEEGRLLEGSDVAATPLSTNFEPAQMTREALLEGLKRLTNRLYEPAAFAARMSDFGRRLGARRDPKYLEGKWRPRKMTRSVEKDARRLVMRIAALGWKEKGMIGKILLSGLRNPAALDAFGPLLLHYAQLRHVYDEGGIWDPSLGVSRSPWNPSKTLPEAIGFQG